MLVLEFWSVIFENKINKNKTQNISDFEILQGFWFWIPFRVEDRILSILGKKKKKFKMDFECPVCKTTKYRNPSMKLLVNVCGHGLCESCVETLFAKGI